MKFREWLNEDKEINESLVFTANDKDANYLLDAAVKSIKALPDIIELKDISNYKNLKKEAKELADSVEEFYYKLIKLHKSSK